MINFEEIKSFPDFGYLTAKFGISNYAQLYDSILKSCQDTDFELKSRDFEKLVFDQAESRKVLFFKEYLQQKYKSNPKQ